MSVLLARENEGTSPKEKRSLGRWSSKSRPKDSVKTVNETTNSQDEVAIQQHFVHAFTTYAPKICTVEMSEENKSGLADLKKMYSSCI